MRWLYTNQIHIDCIDVALALLDASHKYDLHALFDICEEAVVQMIGVDTCAQVHYIASKVSATKALIECDRITAQYWDCIKSELDEVAEDASESEDAEGTVNQTPFLLLLLSAPLKLIVGCFPNRFVNCHRKKL